MKKVLLLSLLPVFISSNSNEINYERKIEQPIVELDRKDIPDVITDGDLLDALIFVESRGNDSAIGDRHLVGNEAVGALQIRPIMVREVNRICKRIGSHQRFTLKDRFDRDKSVHMFLIWKEFHHKDSSPEKIARNWNGGPKGYKKDRTIKYWNKIEKQLNNE
ncbi:MAG: hypothetical protein HKN40_02070 [Winogradskyella sp.]|uniref:hypothetical protein n=1 Tax=Winogradskyella sp. TaxID=1883156 RepID=UPI0017C08B39|nr:hypothetical protein [Winogradskyella sp.]